MVRVVRLERTVSWSQTRRDTNFAIPGYSISAIIPRREEKSKFFLSVVIPVVKAAFMPLSAIGENSANAGVARLCSVSTCPIPDTATALPKAGALPAAQHPGGWTAGGGRDSGCLGRCRTCGKYYNVRSRFLQAEKKSARCIYGARLVCYNNPYRQRQRSQRE